MIIPPNRSTLLEGKPNLRFAAFLVELTAAVNKLTAPPVNTQDSSYTFVLADAGSIIRKTSTTVNQIYTIPANVDVAIEVGSQIEIQNDGTVDLDIAIDTDTLTSEAGLGTGTRILAAAGSAVLRKVAATKWKIRGEQLT